MASIIVTIPDAQLTRVVNGLCAMAGVAATPANAKVVVLSYIKTAVLSAEQQAAVQAIVPGPEMLVVKTNAH